MGKLMRYIYIYFFCGGKVTKPGCDSDWRKLIYVVLRQIPLISNKIERRPSDTARSSCP